MSDNWSEKQKLREAVIESVIKGDKENVEKYLDQGADVDESQGGYLTKKTLLMLAIENNYEDIARMLVDRGADLTCSVTVDKVEKNVVQLAEEKKMDSLAEYIHNIKDANDELLTASKSDNSENAETAINKGANINLKLTDPDHIDLPNASILMLSIRQKSIAVATLLINKGANLTYTIQCEDGSGGEATQETARTLSVKTELEEITKLIDDTLTKLKETEQTESESIQNTEEKPETDVKTQNAEELQDCDDNDFQETENNNKPTKKRTQQSASICIII